MYIMIQAKVVDKRHGSYHWTLERYVAVGMFGLVTTPFLIGPSKVVDVLLGFAVPLHLHMGWGQVIL
jgi:succinate dehydrogenase (ubiquinone) membrane anchor subunit